MNKCAYITKKVYFVSVLGTNDYLPCRYYFNHETNQNLVEARFVQEAILRLKGDEKQNIKALIFCTKEAEKTNWRDNGHRDRSGSILKRKGLESQFRDLQVDYELIKIPTGKNEEEIWQVFNILVDKIKEKSRLEIDITHSFRSLSMIILAGINFIKVLKNTRVDKIYYGAMEALGNIQQIKAMEIEKRMVPILDLTPFDAILEWAYAINSFKKSGSPAHLNMLAMEKVHPILRSTKGQDNDAKAVRDFVKSLSQFCDCLALNRGPETQKTVKNARDALDKVKNVKLLPPLIPLFTEVEDELSKFTGDSLDVAVQVASWCLEHNFIPQGYTALQEGIITWCLESLNKDVFNVSYRDAVTSAVKIKNLNLDESKWNKKALSQKELIAELFAQDWFNKMTSIMDRVTTKRNDINHGGYKEDYINSERLKKDLNDLIKEIRKIKS